MGTKWRNEEFQKIEALEISEVLPIAFEELILKI